MKQKISKYLETLSDDRRGFLNIAFVALIASLFVFCGVYFATAGFIFKRFHLGEKGSLGDAVNGLSAPFISFFSAILIYITFKEQNKANKLLQTQWQVDTYLKLYNDLENRFKALNIPVVDANRLGSGTVTAIDSYEFINFIFHHYSVEKEESSRHLNSLIIILDDFVFLAEYIQSAPKDRQPYFRKKLLRFHDFFLKDVQKLNGLFPENIEQFKSFKVTYAAYTSIVRQLHLKELVYRSNLLETKEN